MGSKQALFFAVISSFTLMALAACTPVGEVIVETATSAVPAQTLSLIVTSEPTQTPAPTETPDAFLSVILPNGAGELYSEDGQWFYNSPRESNIGKNVPVVITEQETVDGEIQTWLGLKDHPAWPLFIQNEDGTWRQAMRYVYVTERFDPGLYDSTTFGRTNAESFRIYGTTYDSGLIDVPHVIYDLSPIVAEEPYVDKRGNWLGRFALPLGNKSTDPMVLFDVVLRPAIADNEVELFFVTHYYPGSFLMDAAILPVYNNNDVDGQGYLVNMLSERIGQQVSFSGIVKILSPFSSESLEGSNLEVITQSVLENNEATDKVLRSLANGNFIESQEGLYIWGLYQVWMKR